MDGQVGQAVTLVVSEAAPGGRLILAPTGSLETDTADVRHFGDAARKGARSLALVVWWCVLFASPGAQAW